MDVKPTAGLKVNVNPSREAIFGDEGVEVKKITIAGEKDRLGTLTGRTLAGYAEVEMQALDGKKHWYSCDEMLTDNGENVVEEEIPIEEPADDDDSEDEASGLN